MTAKGLRYSGLVYRALNPVYARNPLSGDGAARYGGRFNRKGRPALYVTLSIQTAILEINQVGQLQPTVLVSYEADLAAVFDATDRDQLASHNMTPRALATRTWRDEMPMNGTSKTQAFAETLIQKGFQAMKVPSFARGATPNDVNIVIWSWNKADCTLTVVDDENRLAKDHGD